MARRHQKHHAGIAQHFRQFFHRHIKRNAKRRDGIRRPGARRQGAIPVLCHRHTAARHHHGCGGRDIQRARRIAPGADDIHRARWRFNRDHPRAHGAHRASHLSHGFTAHAHRHQHASDLRWCRFACHDDAEGFFGLGFRQARTIGEPRQDGFQRHGIRPGWQRLGWRRQASGNCATNHAHGRKRCFPGGIARPRPAIPDARGP